jgi:adenylate kinase family enzyme
VRLLLLAPPGAGKGTQGERLADRLAVRHVSAGEQLRAEARAGTPVGREPEAVTTEILARLSDHSSIRGTT